MATTTVEEFINKINELSHTDRAELLRRLNQPQPKNGEPKKLPANGHKGYVSPDTIWIKENSHLYRGQYVAIKNGKFVASGRTIKEADQAAKAKGVNDPLLHYVFPADYIPWGGW
ncbi:MAG: DUF5678 domain-containing protein [Pyrinomonadaceae bacterium]